MSAQPQAACSCEPRAGARGGALACKPRCVRIFSITGCQGTEALALARRKRSSGPFTSGLTPQDRRDDLQLAAAVGAVFQVDLESEASAKANFYSSHAVAKTLLSSLAQLRRMGR